MSDEIKAGKETTEYAIAKWLGIAGVALQGLAGALASSMPNATWVSMVLAISGALTAIAGALGYQIPRAMVKYKAISQKNLTL